MSRVSALGQAVPHRCPACGAVVRATPAARKRKVRCPSCREAVLLESIEPGESEAGATDIRAAGPQNAGEAVQRIEALEARVANLEAALAQALAAAETSGA